MSGTDIDFGNIQQPAVPQQRWNPPVHKYYGPKNADGDVVPEPLYVRDKTNQAQNYPCMRYKLVDGRIKAAQVNTDDEELALGDGWEDSPAKFGAITAPTFEQSRLAPPKLSQPAKRTKPE